MQHFAAQVFSTARPAQPAEQRHARLFELIRQENLSGALAVHIDRHCEDASTPEMEAGFCEDFLAEASRSLGMMYQVA